MNDLIDKPTGEHFIVLALVAYEGATTREARYAEIGKAERITNGQIRLTLDCWPTNIEDLILDRVWEDVPEAK